MSELESTSESTNVYVQRVRYPEIIATEDYLNDPIKFRADPRFIEPTFVSQSVDSPYARPNQIKRDFAEFLQIDRNYTGSQVLSVNMVSPHWNRVSYEKVIGPRSEFTQFGVTS
jgi:hypothetical protein